MEVVLAIFGKIAEYTVAPIGHQLGYLIQYSSNTESLRDQVESLKSVQHGNQGEVDAAERNGQVIREDVRTWLTRVDEITAESDIFFRDEVNPNLKCSSFSSCPNLVLRYKVSRKAKKKKLVVDEFLLKGKFNNVSFPPQPPPILEPMNVGDVEVFKSRDSTFKGIIEALKDDKTNIIGVYGMGGIGKTMLVKGVANHTKEYKLFDDIVLTVVSQTPSITKIQDDIASILGLELHERESVLIRAGRLCERIKKSKRILVILDDLWTKLDLKEIGLPQVDVHKGCKILFTTRDYRVCVEMRSQIKFPIKVLSELEAWDLFRKVAGDVVDSYDLKPIANEVAKECAGLPLSIVTVAGTLMEVKDLSVWRVALRRLQNPSTTNIPGMSAKVYSSLSLSYDFLDDKEAKDCFLLCCLAEEDSDIRINNLVGFGMGLGIFDYTCTLLDIKDTVRALVTKLKDKGLLLESKYVDCVRMHDVVRDFATSVLSEVQHGSWARIEWSQKILSALNNDKFDCSTLKMLFLKSYDDDSLVIPDNFFERGKDIRVLSMHIPKLPSSVLFLVSLRTLYLEGCSVEDISFIGNLKCLEILSFVRCHIQEFPREIEQLKSLRVLEFSKCVGLKVIPVGFLSSLSQLEGLYMYMSFVDWGKDSNASLVELNDLRGHLSTIDIHLPDVKFFPKDLHLETLSEFKISLGTEFSGVEWNDSFFPAFDADDTFKCLNPRMLKVGNVDQSISSHDGVKMLVSQAESLIIEHFEVDLENILSELKREGFSRLKCLKVTRNQKIEYLVDKTKEDMLQKIFPALEGLKLGDMRNLSELCRGRLPNGSFCQLCELELNNLPNLENLWVGNASLLNLRVVNIRYCCSMKNLFSQNVLSGFGQLLSLQVESCQNIEEILAYDGAEAIEEDEIEFSNFKILRLFRLPNLTTFCSKRGNHILDGRDDAAPPIQRAFFSEKIAFPNLEELEVSGKFEEIWPQIIPGYSFCKLRVLDIDGFHKIKTAIPSNLVQRLQNLEELRVTCCGGLKEIVATKELGEEETGDMKIVFPQLDEIELKDLRKLACFCNGNCTLELPLLRRFTIEKCPKLETLFISSGCEGKESQTASSSNSGANLTEGFNRAVQSLFNEKVLLPSLESLDIRDLHFLKEIWYNQRILPADHSFSQLKSLYIYNCECLRNVIVAEEDQRQEICMREEEEEEKIIITVFPQLRELWLEGLPQLKCFYNGRHCKLEFPSLATVQISGCPKIETLMGSTSSGYKCTELRRKELIDDDDDDQEGSTNIIAKMEDDDDDIHTIMLFTEQVLLPSLESLYIWNLESLKEIWYNQRLLPADHSFSQLKELWIRNCECLRNVLTPSIAKVLSSLRKIEILSCLSLEAVIVAEEDQRQEICMREEEEEEENIIITVFPQLSFLVLEELPQLKCFYNGRHCKLEFPSLVEVRITDCPKIEALMGSTSGYKCTELRRKELIDDDDDDQEGSTNIIAKMEEDDDDIHTIMLFTEQVLLPSLERLTIEHLESLKEIWYNQRLLPADHSFSQLKSLTIRNCECLRNVLTPSIAKVLSSLTKIGISLCSSLEAVIVAEEDQRQEICTREEEEENIITVFPQLTHLSLNGLPELKCFCSTMAAIVNLNFHHWFKCTSTDVPR